jgi:hypothetical protein
VTINLKIMRKVIAAFNMTIEGFAIIGLAEQLNDE